MSGVHTKFKTPITPRKSKFQRKSFFLALRWTSFLRIPLTFLYSEYIDRPKLTEQKNPFKYIVPPSTSEVGTITMANGSALIVSVGPGLGSFKENLTHQTSFVAFLYCVG